MSQREVCANASPMLTAATFKRLLVWTQSSLKEHQAEFQLFLYAAFIHTYLNLYMTHYVVPAKNFFDCYKDLFAPVFSKDLEQLRADTEATNDIDMKKIKEWRKKKTIEMSFTGFRLLRNFVERKQNGALLTFYNTYISVNLALHRAPKTFSLPTTADDLSRTKRCALDEIVWQALPPTAADADVALRRGGEDPAHTKYQTLYYASGEGLLPRVAPSEELEGAAQRDLEKRRTLSPSEERLPSVLNFALLDEDGPTPSAAHVSADGACFAAALDGACYVWDMAALTRAESEAEAHARLRQYALSPFDVPRPGILSLPARKPPPSFVFRSHVEDITAIATTPDARTVVTASLDGLAKVHSLDFSTPVASFSSCRGPLFAAACAPFSHMFLTGGFDRILSLWSPEFATPLRIFHNQSAVTACAFHPAGGLVAAGTEKGVVRLFVPLESKAPLHRAAGDVARQLSGHSGPVSALAFSPDGLIMAAGTRDGKLYLWEIAEGRLLLYVPTGFGAARSLDFSPCAGVLAAGFDGGAIALLDVVRTRVKQLIPPTAHFPYAHMPAVSTTSQIIHIDDDPEIVCGVFPAREPSRVLAVRFTRRNLLVSACAWRARAE
eukprot:gnl/Chilomastix_cuspidata/4206.p1 GENE.gnl/Chilomastix_cuspidata/4206~~gnl/Chilomastix_cuspidata/4206.p1  ORF type:complete len:609 (-),score=326.17 gnl/Chilomastix_cuspidata/4206:8-1834(-)